MVYLYPGVREISTSNVSKENSNHNYQLVAFKYPDIQGVSKRALQL
jgi:hypothetical protein